MPSSNHMSGRPNPWYPRLVSDRADELIGELDEAHVRRLFDALKTISLSEWLEWIEEARAEISAYDFLTRSQRKRQLQKQDATASLKLHHACVFVELWRARTHTHYFTFPPSGAPIDNPVSQREMMLAVLASYNAIDPRDIWPFDLPEDENGTPFRSELP